MVSLKIRPIQASDAEELRALYLRSLSENVRGFVQNPLHHGDIYTRAEACQANNGDFIGAFIEDKLVGMGSLKKNDKDDSRVELGNLHVHSDYQRMGIGRQVARVLVAQAKKRNYKFVELHVTASQEAAVALYQSLGFEQTDRRFFDVAGQSFDTIFMELNLVFAT